MFGAGVSRCAQRCSFGVNSADGSEVTVSERTDCDLHTGHPEPDRLVSGRGGHEMTGGRELDTRHRVLVSHKPVGPHLRPGVPDHDTRIHRAAG